MLRGLLNKWGLELQHLNPTRVLHITGFVTIYEVFLGMEPHMAFSRFTLQKRPKPSVPYPMYSPSDSNRGWHGE